MQILIQRIKILLKAMKKSQIQRTMSIQCCTFRRCKTMNLQNKMKQAYMLRNATTIKELSLQLDNKIKRDSVELNGIVKNCEFLKQCNQFLLDYIKDKSELKNHCIQNINIMVFDGRKHTNKDLMILTSHLIDQSDFEDTVEQAKYIFSDQRAKLIMKYIDKIKQFRNKNVKRNYKSQETYEEKIINKLNSLFEEELKIDEVLRVETPSVSSTLAQSASRTIRSHTHN